MLGWAVMLTLVLLAATILLHHEVVHRVLGWAAASRAHARMKTLVAMVAFVVAHNVAIWLYAAGYWLGSTHLGIGGFAPGAMTGVLDYVFFSAEAYTSIGLDNFKPIGGVRLIAGMEAVVGLMMIAWSGSATYLVLRSGAPRMRRRWPEEPESKIVNE